MSALRTSMIFCLMALLSCGAQKPKSRYRAYQVKSPVTATSFEKVSAPERRILLDSYSTERDAPIRLTASDGTGLQLVGLRANAVVDGPMAFTELRLKFRNPQKREIEGRFEILVPDSAKIARVAMRRGSEWQEGEIVARRRAQQVYEDFLHNQVDPILLESTIGNRFRARVYPIAAKSDKEIIVSYSEVLPASGEYQLLLGGLPQIPELELDVRRDGKRTRMKEQGFVPSGPIVVKGDVGAKAFVAGELAMLRWNPQSVRKSSPLEDLTILFDTSASGAGVLATKLDAIANLMERLAKSKSKRTIRIAAFDNHVEDIFSGKAHEFGKTHIAALRNRGAFGASNLEAALVFAAGQRGRTLLVSDGIATLGERGFRKLKAKAQKAGTIERLDILSIAANRHLRLQEELLGIGEEPGVFLRRDGSSEEWLHELTLSAPRSFRISVEGAEWVWPTEIQPHEGKSAATIFAKFPSGHLAITKSLQVQTQIAGASQAESSITKSVAVEKIEPAFVERQWAATYLERLEALQRQNYQNDRQDKIERISHRFRVLSDSTSFLMLESERDYSNYGIDRNDGGDILTVDATGIRRLPRGKSSAREEEWKAMLSGPEKDFAAAPARSQRPSVASSSETSGEIHGIVKDKSNGEVLAGVTVVLTQGENGRSFTAITDEKGFFRLSNLLPGQYEILFSYGDVRAQMHALRVSLGKVTMVYPKLDLSTLGGELVVIEGRPSIDTSSTRQGMTIDRDYVRNLPIPGRTFDGVLNAAAGSSSDELGKSFSGSSSLENQYVVDGVNTTGLRYGSVGSPTINDFVEDSGERKNDRARARPGRPLRHSEKRFREIRNKLATGSTSSALSDSLRWAGESHADILALLSLGESLEASGYTVLAARAYSSIIDIFPTRSDMHRLVAVRLSRLGKQTAKLRLDFLQRAREFRPDHVHGRRLLAMELFRNGKEEEALTELLSILQAKDVRGRVSQARELIRYEAGVIAAAWLGRRPKDARRVKTMLEPTGIMVPMGAMEYVVLSWESDVARVDLRVTSKEHMSEIESASQSHIGALGYGPESVRFDGEAPEDMMLYAEFSEQAMAGFAFAHAQIVSLGDDGSLRVEDRPFVLLKEREQMALGPMKMHQREAQAVTMNL